MEKHCQGEDVGCLLKTFQTENKRNIYSARGVLKKKKKKKKNSRQVIVRLGEETRAWEWNAKKGPDNILCFISCLPVLLLLFFIVMTSAPIFLL